MLQPNRLKSPWVEFGQRLKRDRRLTTLEILLIGGALIGWGFLPIPRTIAPFFALASMSLWVRGLSWRDVGLRRPRQLRTTILTGMSVAIGAAVVGHAAVLPALRHVGAGEPPVLEEFQAVRGNVVAWLGALILVWVLAALIEEMVFRGYLLNRLADLFGQSRIGWLGALLGSSIMFLGAHEPTSWRVIATTLLMGVLEGGAYLGRKRNLWMPITIHGVADTISLTLVFLGAV